MRVKPLLLIRFAFRETLGLVGMGVALFWSAGRITWWPGWAALAVMLVWIVATAVVILRVHPDLLAERLGPRKGAKTWDTAIVSSLGLVQLARYIVAGLDQRYAWSGGTWLIAQIIALVVCLLSYATFVWATAVNAFFSQVARVQTERGHTVVTGGPYRYVRHPGYAGAITYELVVSVLLGSWWAFIPSVIGALLLLLRTVLEDRMLRAELPGYADYARTVRYRLIPGIW